MTKSAGLSREAERLIETVSQLMGGPAERMLVSISQGEYGLLKYLAGQESSVSSNDISRAMRIGPGGVANLIKTMEAKGLVRKVQSTVDRRANCVSITEAGRAQLAERYQSIMDVTLYYLEKVGLKNSMAFNDMLDKFRDVSVTGYQAAPEDGE